MKKLLWAVLVLAACGQKGESPLQGYIEGEYVRVAAPFAGWLQQLSVSRGDEVKTGAPIFALESENEVAARRQAEQQLQGAEARLADLRKGKRPPEVATVAQQLQQARASRDLSATTLRRQEQLRASGFISAAALDDARAQFRRDDAQVRSLEASVATANLPAREDEIRAAEAEVRAAREVLSQAEWRLSQRTVASPATGTVIDTYYVVGDWVQAGGAVASLLPPANVKARFYVPETVLGRLKLGQTVSIACDGCAAAIAAPIAFIADRAEFTPPVLYSKDNRSKLVYLVEAKPAPEDAVKLHPGQPIDVTLPK
jgi:HlyD family secretion protein